MTTSSTRHVLFHLSISPSPSNLWSHAQYRLGSAVLALPTPNVNVVSRIQLFFIMDDRVVVFQIVLATRRRDDVLRSRYLALSNNRVCFIHFECALRKPLLLSTALRLPWLFDDFDSIPRVISSSCSTCLFTSTLLPTLLSYTSHILLILSEECRSP